MSTFNFLRHGVTVEQDAAKSGKMSKSNPDSGIFMHDDAESIRSKIKRHGVNLE